MTSHLRVLALWSSIAFAAACGDNGNKAAPDAAPPDSPPADPTLVMTASGPVKGSIMDNSRQFLGIPYAKPPVGDLRWKAPQAPAPWTTPLDATKFGKRCAQLASAVLQNAASNDEDCLYLNVWTPSPAPQAALPVMIWIHGGGNVNGSTSEPVPFVNSGVFYSGEFLAGNHGVVVVSMNYRLGIFGFFPHAALDAEGTPGNQGLLDQRAAMQWVHDNIAQFGGDPANVTIFGESAGSQDVCFHVASPGSAGLFERAISESGGCTTLLTSKATAETNAATFATDLGCTGADADVLTCLRGKSTTDLMTSMDVAKGFGFGPDVDGAFMPDQPRTLYTGGHIAKVPYLLGSNNDEGTLFTQGVALANDTDFDTQIKKVFPSALVAMIESMYSPNSDTFKNALPNPDQAAYSRVIGDEILVCTTFDTAQLAAAAGSTVFQYNFDVPIPATIPGNLGATHGSELTSVFGTDPLFASDAAAKAVSDEMERYWTNFAKTGNPNGGSDPNWPSQAAMQNIRINFTTQATTTVMDFRAIPCGFWRGVYAAQFPAGP